MTSELLDEVKKYSAQMNQNAQHAEVDQTTQNFIKMTVGGGNHHQPQLTSGTDGERPFNDMQNMSGIGGISDIEYDQ